MPNPNKTMKKIADLDDKQLCKLIDNRVKSSETVWNIVNATYDRNVMAYKNKPEWLAKLARKKSKVRANRIFVNTEAVINSLISNPPKPNVLPAGANEDSK